MRPPPTREEFEALQREVRDARAAIERIKSELEAELSSTYDAIRRYVEDALTAVAMKVDTIEGTTSEMLALVKAQPSTEALRSQMLEDQKRADERLERMLGIASRATDIRAKQDSITEIHVDGRSRRRTALLTVLGPILVALIGLAGAAIASHYGSQSETVKTLAK